MSANILLETPRLWLRPLVNSDWPMYFELKTHALVQQNVGDIQSDSLIRQGFESRLPSWDKKKNQWLCLVIVLKETEEVLGVTGFLPEWEPYQQAEVGYMLHPSHHRKGYGAESLRAVVQFALEQCQFHKLKATVTEGNTASCYLLEKLGFQKEGLLRDNFKMNGAWKNDIVYG